MKQQQQKKAEFWLDEAGNKVPYVSIKRVEKVHEKIIFDIARKAYKVSKQLGELKKFIEAKVKEAVDAFHRDYKGKKTDFKGNYTLVSFAGDVKIEISVSKPIKFDDLLIQKAQAELEDFLNEGVSAKNAAIKEMVIDAFETTRGKMDVKKILGLTRYKDRINDNRYSKAMDLIAQAQRRPDTAVYYRVSLKDENNQWKAIPLSLSDNF